MRACDECGGDHFAKNKCRLHYKMPSEINPKPLSRVSKPIKKVSKSRAKGLVIYGKEKADYFKQYPTCQFPGCESEEITLHHSKGRIGALLYDKTHFKSLCWPHHKFCEENPEIAKKLELSINRLSI